MTDAPGTPAIALTTARPVLAVALSILVLSAMDAVIKGFGPDSSILQIVWLRYVSGALFVLPVLIATRPHRITLRSFKMNGLRAVIMIVAASTFFYAITRLPLVEAVTLSFTAPIFMIFAARIILGEPITARAIGAVGLGFFGVLVVVAGDMGAERSLTATGIGAALLSAVAYAVGIVLLRKHSSHDSLPVLVFLQAAIASVILFPAGVLAWDGFGTHDLIAYTAIGLFATVGQLLIAWGFKHAEAARLAPIEYTNMLWATVFGIAFFHERPAWTTFAGAVLIILACLIATRPGWPIFPRRRYTAPGG